jgi:hypothetical protein
MKWRSFNKYNAKRTNGFSSKLEAQVYELLKLRELAGEIKEIRCQYPIVLQEGKKELRITWKVDFSFIDVKTGQTVFCESKGIEDGVFKLKLKLYKKNRTEKLEIWRGSWKKPFLSEIINAKA